MKTVFDLKEINGLFSNIENGSKIEKCLKEKIEKETFSAVNREHLFDIPVCGNKEDPYAFSFLKCYIVLKLKRTYSNKTWKIKKETYSIQGYEIKFFDRKYSYEDYKQKEIWQYGITNRLLSIEDRDENGNMI